MAVTVEEFAAYVGETFATSNRQVDLTRSLAVASAELAPWVEGAVIPIPQPVVDLWTLDVANAIYRRSENFSGQYEESGALRAPNDPLAQIRPMLERYVLNV